MRWLNREWLTIYPRIFLAFYILLTAILLISAARSQTGELDFLNRPLGPDFSQFWAASFLALQGKTAAIYNLPEFIAAQEAIFKIKFPFPWVYPPTYLLLVLPLALLPYLTSLGVWLVATMIPYLAVVRRIAPHSLVIWLVLAFPGTFQNFFHGQNGFLTAALIGWGLVYLDEAPWLGGCLLGLVSFKPHLLILLPIALVAGKRWRALTALLASALLLGLISFLVLRGEVWQAYWDNAMLAMKLVAEGAMPVDKMITPFAAALNGGVRLPLALVIQVGVMVGVAAGVFWVWSKNVPLALRGAVLVVGILLATPHAFSYDMTLLALPLAWLGWEGYSQGFDPWEQSMFALVWLLPLLVPIFSIAKFQVVPLFLMALFILVLKKCKVIVLQPESEIFQRGNTHV